MKNSLSKLVPIALLTVFLAVMAPPNQAQVGTTLTQVYCQPSGPQFVVDGGSYGQPMSAFWPIGSKHTLSIPQGNGVSYNMNQTIAWTFGGWQWAGGTFPGSTITVTADPTISAYVATFTAQYQFNIKYFSCSDPVSCAASPGIILVNGAPISSDMTAWQVPGGSVMLQASANPGWIFAGWQPGPNQVITGFQNVVTVSAPMTVYPIFVPAKTINFATNPPNMKLYADGVLIETPDSLQWGEGTVHSVAAVPNQTDAMFNQYVFSSWSDGGALSHSYTVANNLTPENLTAIYTPGVSASFLTVPGGLNLTIDGLAFPPPYAFLWGIGSTHTLQAPQQQTDAQGGVWTFSKWDDGTATATRSVTVPQGSQAMGIRMEAIYTGNSRLTITSTVGSQAVTVDGTACTTPCSVLRPVGTQVHVSAPASVPLGTGSRQDFLGWSANGGSLVAGDWVATLSQPAVALTATYHLMNSLTTAANPTGGAQWSITPASPDGFYDSQTQVALAVSAQPGYRFATWIGDLSGSVPSGTLAMTTPRSVVAQLNVVPYLATPPVYNGAGVTPEKAVAAGSVATIYGLNLASSAAVGPSNPLVQTLAGATVQIGTTLLPLYFASPEQINLQVPPSLDPGTQTLTVSPQGMSNISADFKIVRNAPGLFPMLIGGQTYALVLHSDGTLVTPDAPAVRGEQLIVYGTGFGPTVPQRPFGFAVPANPPYLVVDPVSVVIGAVTFGVDSSYALPGSVGIDAVQFHLDNTVPSGSNISFQVTVNGVNSNTLLLPVQ